ncbi:hypothetical protein HK099_006099 [Clydaea vesicula]|uniref:Cation efflux protein transmembrane domain-containing protein n=1 Tax=Clydaea vesicula TaxID=447962 RepID=A0AAD5XUH9_9FUNG|nr:hypothetical protein HK099_006099 [Clydaea vesicula]
MRRDVTMVEGNLQRKETLEGSQKVVAFAITSNFLMFSGKLYAAIVSGSSSMFSEALHSLADILNECLLMWGILRSLRQPDPDHPYGFTMERYAWALVSGVGIFFLGGGVSIYHGVSSIIYPHALGDPTMAWYVLGASLLFEGATMTYAFRTIRKAAIQNDVSTKEYVLRGADPTTVQVLLEDVAAVTGILIAGISISLSSYLAMPILDSIGSISIGLLLGSVAGFLVKRNISSLVERRMDLRKEREIVRVLSEDPVVKTEILFQGDHITERYLHSLSTEELEKELLILKNSKTDEEIKEWVVKHGSGVIGMLGSEVDRLEWEIKKAVPQVKHCDLEIL